MRKRNGGARVRLAWAALALAAAACGDGKDDPLPRAPLTGEPRETPQPGGTAVLAEQSDLERPIPIIYQSIFDSDLIDVMFMGLTRAVWRDGRLVYLLADESPMAIAWHWEYARPDSTAIRYRMRSALRWSDGRPITAQDVVWTYRMLKDPAAASPRQQDVSIIDSVRAENDSTVVFHFARRSPEMLFATNVGIVPRHPFEGAGAAGLRTHPVLNDPTQLPVSGAFRVGAWRPGERITLVPNSHFRPAPLLRSIVIRIIPEMTTRLVELQTGNVDMVRGLSGDRIPALRQRAPNVRFEKEERRFWEYVAYNPREVAAFRDVRVRRALGMALDRATILRSLRMEEFGEPAVGPYPPIFRDLYDPRRTPAPAQDTAQARRLLAEAGWRDTDGDGVLDRDGKPLRFTLVTNAGNPRRADLSLILQQQWKRLGVDVELRQMEFNTFMQRQRAKEFEAMIGSWGVNLNPDLEGLFGTDAELNIVSFRDTAAQRLITQAKAQPTAELATPLWRAVAERIVQEQPYTWLYYYDQVNAVNDRLRGMKVDTYGAYQNAWEWWIPRARQGRSAGADSVGTDSAGTDSAAAKAGG